MSCKKNSNLPAKSCSVFPPVSFLGETKSRRKIRAKKHQHDHFPQQNVPADVFWRQILWMESRTSCLSWVKSKLSSPFPAWRMFFAGTRHCWSEVGRIFVVWCLMIFCFCVESCSMVVCTKIQRVLKDAVGFGAKKTISTSLSLCLAVAVKSSNRHVVVMIRTSMKICFRKVCLLRRFPQYQTGVSLNKSIFRKKMRSQNPQKS